MARKALSNSIIMLAATAGLMILAVALAPRISSAGGNGASKPNPDDFSTHLDNPLFPLSSLGPKVFEGEEIDPDLGVLSASLTSTVLPKTAKVAGVDVLVLEENSYVDGELIESALDFFAQHRDGTVYYFGERVDNYENGKLVDHGGTWLAGRNGIEPGIIMPPHPFVNQVFQQENAPGVAEDQVRVLATNESVSTPAGNFTGCLKTEDSTPLDPGVIDTKWYCPGVGLVRDEATDGFVELASYTIAD